MFTTLKTLTCAGIFAGTALTTPLYAVAKTQIPEHYKISAAANYDASAVQQSYVALAGGLYSNALNSALALLKSIDTFTNAPNDVNLAAARTALTGARSAYLATEAFRFYGGPIDGPKTARSAAGPEKALNANFSLLVRAFSGSNSALIAQIGGKTTAAANQRKALSSAAAALQSDLTFVLKEWDPIRRTGYAQEFLQLDDSEAVGRILRGLGLQAASLSANTRGGDAVAILAGMHSIWHAQLNNIDAPSVEAMLTKIDANAASAVSSAIATAQTQANSNDPALPATLNKLALAISNAGTSLGVAIK